MRDPRLEKKQVLVVGLARSGIAAANFLYRRGARVSVTDSQSAEKLQSAVQFLQGNPRLLLGGHAVNDFLSSDLIVLSPGVPSDLKPLQQARAAGVPVWSEVELAFRYLSGPVVGVTGSNGKTTTTALIGALFEKAGIPNTVAGNIGTALTGTLDEADRSQTWIVELSSFQLENIDQFHCQIAVLLNLSPDHQDRYASYQDYQMAKANIFKNQSGRDHAIGNADDPLVRRLVQESPAPSFWFSRHRLPEQGTGICDGQISWNWQGKQQQVLPACELRIQGQHNLENALAAVAVGVLSELPSGAMAEALKEFPGVEHRLEWVRNLDGVDFYNDSKATNVDSARVALQALQGPLVVILGGLEKGQPFEELESHLCKKARQLVLIGETADRLERLFGEKVSSIRAKSLEEAVKLAASKAEPGDAVVLAPACASFDMFEHFEHRGQVFKAAVNGLDTRPGVA